MWQARHGRGCGVWHPVGLPKGYHVVPQGQAWQARPAVERDVAPGVPRGRAAPGRRDATQPPACKIIYDRQRQQAHNLRYTIATSPALGRV